MSFNTPILFLVFNRPDTTRQVFERIKAQKPKYLYVAADGARPDKTSEKQMTEEVRKIATNVNWDCELKTLFRDENLGCKDGPRTAINWFFDQVEEGIILEDDCLPDLSFFIFCEIMLKRYRYDNKIISINGCNLGYHNYNESYIFTRYMNCWGWASWRRASKIVKYEIAEWNKINKISFLRSRLSAGFIDFDMPWFIYWKENFDSITGVVDSVWDYFWLYYQFKYKKLSIVPSVNLIKNIGFSEKASHTKLLSHPSANLSTHEMNFPLIFKKGYSINNLYEKKFVKPICYMHTPLPNSFYIKKWLSKQFPFSILLKLKRVI